MKLNNYLRIKKADYTVPEIYEATRAYPEGNADLAVILSSNGYGNVTEQDVKQVTNRLNLYNKLLNGSPLHYDAIAVPNHNGSNHMLTGYVDPNTGKVVHYNDAGSKYINLMPNDPFTTLLHEKGHGYTRYTKHMDYPTGEEVSQLAKPFGKYKLYDINSIPGVLADEYSATDYARKVINTIQDKKLRDSLSSELNGNLNPAYLSYVLKYGRPYNGAVFGSKLGRTVGALGLGAGLGYAGYKGGDALAKLLKFENNSWKHNILRYGLAGLAGLGGAYIGGKYGNKLGSNAGQLAVQWYDDKSGYYAKKRKQIERIIGKANRNANKNITALEQYANKN